MGVVVELSAHRHDPLQRLFDAHRATITEFICSYTCHVNEPNLATLTRFLDAQDAFVCAYHALEDAP